MTKNYTRYTADQLLNDDFFLESELHPTPESQLFWNQLEKENESLVNELQIARTCLNTLKQHTP